MTIDDLRIGHTLNNILKFDPGSKDSQLLDTLKLIYFYPLLAAGNRINQPLNMDCRQFPKDFHPGLKYNCYIHPKILFSFFDNLSSLTFSQCRS